MVIVSLDSPSCEVTLFGPVYRWFIGTLPDRPIVLYRLRYEVALRQGLAYLSRYNSGWFCHSWYQSYKVTLEIHFTLKIFSV
jgi:hypothetical protein